MRTAAAIAAVAWLAMVSSAAATPGLRLVQREAGGGKIVLIVSPAGSRLIEQRRVNGRLRAAGGGLVNYRRNRVVMLDPARKVYSSLNLRRAVTDQRRERKLLLSSRAAVAALREQGVKPPPKKVRLPRAHARRGGRARRIAGLLARPVILVQGKTKTRIWYAQDLPGPPTKVRRSLAKLGDRAAKGSADRALAGHLDDVVLRREVRRGRSWRRVLNTVHVRRLNVRPKSLRAPPGWDAEALPSRGPRKAGPRTTPAGVTPLLGGPILAHPAIFSIYWGSTFARTGFPFLMDGFLKDLISRPETRPFWGPLAQYGVGGAVFTGSTSVVSDPFVTVGNWNFFGVGAMIATTWGSSGSPWVWWRQAAFDPVITVFVDQEKVATGSWSGYHLWVASPAVFLPFPAPLFAHPAVPYLIVKAPNSGGIPSVGASTPSTSHELVEAATDPYPFEAWIDPTKFPVWAEGEITDICQSAPSTFGSMVKLLGNTLETYWSNAARACVPSTAVSLSIIAPTAGQSIRADHLFFSGSASSPLDGDISNRITWTDETGKFIKFGAGGAPTTPFTLGAHTLTARVSDFNSPSQSATASVSFTITADPPQVAVTSPTTADSLTDDQPVKLRGSVVDPQGRGFPAGKVRWLVDGNPVGADPNGPDYPVNRLLSAGPHTITLEATNFWGQTRSATRMVSVAHAVGHSPVVTITNPATSPFYAATADTVPIPLTATATDAEDGPLSGTAVKWFDTYTGVSGASLGSGTSISTLLARLQADQAANRYTEHTVRVEATDSAGNTTSATVLILVGIIIS